MISDYVDLVNKIKMEKISKKELIDIINLNGFSKEKLNELLTLVSLSEKYFNIIPKINNSQIEKFIDIKLDTGDYYILLKYTSYFNLKSIKKLIANLLKDANLEMYCRFANLVKDEYKSLFLDLVLESFDAEYVYTYASKVKNSNVKLLEDRIIEINNIPYLYYFARDIKGADVKKLEEAMISNYQAIDYLVDFARLDGIDINKFEDLILKTDNPYLIVSYANNPKSNLLKVERRIIEIGNLECLLLFASNSRIQDYTSLEDIFISLNNHFYIYKFANELYDKVNVLKLEDALLNCNDKDSYDENSEEEVPKIYSVYAFARDLANHGADVSRLEDYVMASNDYYYIYKFYVNVPNANKDRLRTKLLEVKSKVELDILDYQNRNNEGLDVEEYYKFIEEYFAVKVDSLELAFRLIRRNFALIIRQIGLVHLFLKLDNRYFRIKEEVLLHVQDKDILETYSNFLNNNLSIELALEIDKKFLESNSSKLLRKVK